MRIIIAIAIYKFFMSEDMKNALATKEGIMMLGGLMVGLLILV